MNRRDFSAFTATLIGAAYSSSTLAQAGIPVEGKHFSLVDQTVLPTVPKAGTIEVLEFFSYACPHCNDFEPIVATWKRTLGQDVRFHRVPVPFLMNSENLMRTYYALETLGKVEAMQLKVFSTIHTEHKYLEKPADIAALMAKNGVDATKFTGVFNSFSVASSVTRAKKLMAAYKLDGVPTVTVQGRWATSPGQAGGLEQALAVTDYLVQRSRTKT